MGKDPEELNNLAENSEYASVLKRMRAHEAERQLENYDLGLADFGRRKPEKWLAAERARAGIKKNEPELWKRLEAGELMETQTWMKKYKSLKK